MWAEDAPDPSLVGDVCHIKAKEPGGARFDPVMSDQLRNAYGNLILLCRIHHKIVDDNETIYPDHVLMKMKADHEGRVASSLSEQDREKQVVREQYSAIVLEWESKASIPEWDRWSSSLVSWYPSVRVEDSDLFASLPKWINTRWWPSKLPLLENSLINYSKWLTLTLSVLYRHAELQNGCYVTPKFYKISNWNEEEYTRLYGEWMDHLKLIEGAMIELCKAANLIAAVVRNEVSEAYRHTEGKFSLVDTFQDSGSLFAGVFEYRTDEIGDGLIFQRSKLYGVVSSTP